MIQEDLEESDVDSRTGDKISKEVLILKHLDHPNIIRFYTSFIENDAVYIVMELHKGQSLADFISS